MGLKTLFFFLMLLITSSAAYPFVSQQDSSRRVSVRVIATPSFDIDSISKSTSALPLQTPGKKLTEEKGKAFGETIFQHSKNEVISVKPAKQTYQAYIDAKEKEIEKELNQPVVTVKPARANNNPHSIELYREYYLLGAVLAMTCISLALLFERDF